MRTVRLDGQFMCDAEAAHSYIQAQLGIHTYSGFNLDALYDVLSAYDKTIWITLINEPLVHEFLGDYGERLIQTFQDIEKINENIQFSVF
ncbi:barstar family protein [Alkalibacterium kapii]|uniref:Barstar (barnase inhibitor) domain-containing protein n=1 Tax=Alkalibacterium kapii TaxID=426704 RepID=A0A511AUY0_9LACT|nr:barstar family protein [Alkalibacterium kapii]GEK92005.1 hypothetical protein AKA01nite_16270 [Alkalibacterium kapii]